MIITTCYNNNTIDIVIDICLNKDVIFRRSSKTLYSIIVKRFDKEN